MGVVCFSLGGVGCLHWGCEALFLVVGVVGVVGCRFLGEGCCRFPVKVGCRACGRGGLMGVCRGVVLFRSRLGGSCGLA